MLIVRFPVDRQSTAALFSIYKRCKSVCSSVFRYVFSVTLKCYWECIYWIFFYSFT